jgi:hypothetical protein
MIDLALLLLLALGFAAAAGFIRVCERLVAREPAPRSDGP